MAVLKLSGLVTSITGKMGGTVFQNGSGGTIAKNNRYKRSRQSPVNYTKRSQFATAAQNARQFTQAQRAILASNAANYTRPTKAGPNTPYNWYSWYMHAQGVAKVCGQNYPVTIQEPVEEPALDYLTVTKTDGAETWTVSGFDNFPSGWYCVLLASRVVLEGQAFRQGMQKIVAVLPGTSGDLTVTFEQYSAVFGAVPSQGKIYWQGWGCHPNYGKKGRPKITLADAQ